MRPVHTTVDPAVQAYDPALKRRSSVKQLTKSTHCRYTGPFFLFMAGIVVAYATGIAALGAHGWAILGLTTVVGNGLIWWGSERTFGTFRRRD